MSLVQQLQGVHARIEGHQRLLQEAEAQRRAFMEEHKQRVHGIKAALAADRELEARLAAALVSSGGGVAGELRRQACHVRNRKGGKFLLSMSILRPEAHLYSLCCLYSPAGAAVMYPPQQHQFATAGAGHQQPAQPNIYLCTNADGTTTQVMGMPISSLQQPHALPPGQQMPLPPLHQQQQQQQLQVQPAVVTFNPLGSPVPTVPQGQPVPAQQQQQPHYYHPQPQQPVYPPAAASGHAAAPQMAAGLAAAPAGPAPPARPLSASAPAFKAPYFATGGLQQAAAAKDFVPRAVQLQPGQQAAAPVTPEAQAAAAATAPAAASAAAAAVSGPPGFPSQPQHPQQPPQLAPQQVPQQQPAMAPARVTPPGFEQRAFAQGVAKPPEKVRLMGVFLGVWVNRPARLGCTACMPTPEVSLNKGEVRPLL